MNSTIREPIPEMKPNRRSILGAFAAVALALPTIVCAETIGVFFDPDVEQIKFAAGDVKTALERSSFTVELLPVASLKTSYSKKKVVIALASDAAVTTALEAQGGSKVAGLGEQAYGLRTTDTPQKSFWALGGDANGAMYGGLQLAEKYCFRSFLGNL